MDKEFFNQQVKRGNLEAVRMELGNGQDPNAPATNGLRPLHQAVLQQDSLMAALLLHSGAEPLLQDNQGRDALDLSDAGGFHGS